MNKIDVIYQEVWDYACIVLQIPADQLKKFTRFGHRIMAAKWDILPKAHLSGFEQAILDNDLMKTFAKADDDNRKLIHSYLIMLNSMSYPSNKLQS